ncbi:MAG: hypothetical protein NC827_09000, partial [Candidatus Omnitrophica bacterium]|nr:hypothetical protein [Candidatus Omnitrophota bacterium]
KEELINLGERNMGFNLILANNLRYPKNISNGEFILKGGADFMEACTMGGGHQMDLRLECDWSDPYVIRGGTGRVVWQAILNQTLPNCLGVHFYDEPGLTWWKDIKTGKMTPHNIPNQMKVFENSFNYQLPHFTEVSLDDKEKVELWKKWGRWKLSFLDSAWKHAKYGVSYVNQDFISCNQSVYGWYAYADGYYFNVVKSLPVILGHGGYDDLPGSYLSPLFYLDMGIIRDGRNKPIWYLPIWYYPMPSEAFRCEMNLCFARGIQGLAVSPPFEMFKPDRDKNISTVVVGFNKTAEKFGTIFTTSKKPKIPKVAFLYSISQCLDAQIRSNMEDNYTGNGHIDKLRLLYIALKMAHIQAEPIVEEDIIDGTIFSNYKVLILTGIDYLEENVIEILEKYISSGGIVFITDDCKVKIKGAEKLGIPISTKVFEKASQLWKEQKTNEAMLTLSAGSLMKEAEPIMKILKTNLEKVKVFSEIDCNSPNIFVFTHNFGDINYIFLVNVSYDFSKSHRLALRNESGEIKVKDTENFKIYNLFTNKEVEVKEEKGYKKWEEEFGPGHMKIYAILKNPIDKIIIYDPELEINYTKQPPIILNILSSVINVKGELINSPIPLKIKVIDPTGYIRYQLYRSTENGNINLALPIGINEPEGKWKIIIEELITGRVSEKEFEYTGIQTSPTVIGRIERAIIFEKDKEKIYRFVRNHRQLTIIKGESNYSNYAAERLKNILSVWDINCSIVNSDEVKVRTLTEEEVKTWVGLVYAGSGQIKQEDSNNPIYVGFDIKTGVTILIGNPEDNKLIKFLLDYGFLPFQPDKNLQGKSRGMISWQYYGVGFERESVCLIAYDKEGMDETIGTFYEIVHGIEPLIPYTYSLKNTIKTAEINPFIISKPLIKWKIFLLDMPVLININKNIEVVTYNSSLITLDKKGNILSSKTVNEILSKEEKVFEIDKKLLLKGKLLKFYKNKDNIEIFVYWGGLFQIINGEKKYTFDLGEEISCSEIEDKNIILGLTNGFLINIEIE